MWVVYVGYLVTQGRIAAAQGVTGLLGERPRSWADEPSRWALPADDLAVPDRLT
jgi:hypothetical protein